MPKLSQLASILNGEIPVILIYLKENVPINFEVAEPEKAAAMLATIEVINEQKKERG